MIEWLFSFFPKALAAYLAFKGGEAEQAAADRAQTEKDTTDALETRQKVEETNAALDDRAVRNELRRQASDR